MTIIAETIHKSCGQAWADHAGGSLRGACPGGTVTKHGVPIMKRAGRPASLTKADVATFAQLQASGDVSEWLSPALDTLATVVWAALYPPPAADGEAEATVDQRIDAVRVSLDEFGEQLLTKVAEAIVKRAGGPVRKRDADGWAGFFR